MPPTLRTVPLWIDRFPKRLRPEYPRFTGDATTDVVVVGGGLTGCACAWTFAAAGIRVVLLEQDRIGTGATGAGVGLIREDFDASFQATASAYGLRAARLLWQGVRRASLEFAATLRRLQVRCDQAPADLLYVTRAEPESTRILRREYQARRDAGLDHSWVTPAALMRETALHAGGAVRTRGTSFDPFRACIGLASRAAQRGAMLYERSPVRRIRAGRKRAEIATERGRISADAVVIATDAPLADLRALRRHLQPMHAYAVVTEPLPAAVRRELGTRTAAVRDDAEPPHFIRWLKEDRVLVSGADQSPIAERARPKVLIQRTGQLMYELSTLYPAISGARAEWGWEFQYQGTVDGLPYLGLHRNFPRHYFALGLGRHGAAVSWLAARLFLRHFREEAARGDELFGFARIL
jgi:glycine/D-amino acid oxidase-like deaminating enzyme